MNSSENGGRRWHPLRWIPVLISTAALVVTGLGYKHTLSLERPRPLVRVGNISLTGCPHQDSIAIVVANIGVRALSIENVAFREAQEITRSEHQVQVVRRLHGVQTLRQMVPDAGLPKALSSGESATFTYEADHLASVGAHHVVVRATDGREYVTSIAPDVQGYRSEARRLGHRRRGCR